MRQITDHKLNGLNDAIEITATDAPGSGGANHEYCLTHPLPAREGDEKQNVKRLCLTKISFQNGPIAKPEDINGVSNEALLAVLIDRMRGFQGMAPVHVTPMSKLASDPAPFRSRENACALTHLEEAMMWLQKRTRDRLARGVEGSLKP